MLGVGHDRNLAISLREPRRAHQHLTIPFPALYSQQPLPAVVIPHHIATFSRLSRYTGLLPARPGPARLGCRLLSITHPSVSGQGRLPSSYSASTHAQLSAFTTVPTLTALIIFHNG